MVNPRYGYLSSSAPVCWERRKHSLLAFPNSTRMLGEIANQPCNAFITLKSSDWLEQTGKEDWHLLQPLMEHSGYVWYQSLDLATTPRLHRKRYYWVSVGSRSYLSFSRLCCSPPFYEIVFFIGMIT